MTPVVLVTGAGSGMGRATVEHLRERGYRVYGGDIADGTLDVCSDESIRTFVERAHSEAGRMDAVVNTAGYALGGAVEETSLDEARAQFETNFFGIVRVTKAVLPILRAQRSGRIINVSSGAGITAGPYHAFYSASKFAVEGYTEALRHEVLPFGVYAVLLEPGSFRTNVVKNGRQAREQIEAYAAARMAVFGALREYCEKAPDPIVVAKCVERILQARRPQLRYRVGKDVCMGFLMRRLLPESVFQGMVAKWYRVPK